MQFNVVSNSSNQLSKQNACCFFIFVFIFPSFFLRVEDVGKASLTRWYYRGLVWAQIPVYVCVCVCVRVFVCVCLCACASVPVYSLVVVESLGKQFVCHT